LLFSFHCFLVTSNSEGEQYTLSKKGDHLTDMAFYLLRQMSFYAPVSIVTDLQSIQNFWISRTCRAVAFAAFPFRSAQSEKKEERIHFIANARYNKSFSFYGLPSRSFGDAVSEPDFAQRASSRQPSLFAPLKAKAGGGGGSRTRVRRHSTQASTCVSRIIDFRLESPIRAGSFRG